MRAFVVIALCVPFLAACGGERLKTVDEANRWPVSRPSTEGLDDKRLELLDRHVREELPNVTSVLVARHGRLVFERYYNGWSRNDRYAAFSVTKSFLSALIGIALRDGKLESVDQKLVSFFDDLPPNHDARLEQITLRHLLTMTAGFDLSDSGTAAIGGRDYELADNWTRYLLARTMSSSPGNRFTYDNGNSHLLSAVLTEATGMSTAEYARRKLFRPLGIDEGGLWPADPQGITRGAVGLQLRPRDFAKLGELYLRGGRWNGRQIVPADYVRESTTMQVRLAPRPGHGYGYHWRVADVLGGQANRPFSFAALGYAGQSIAVVPSHDLVVVTTAQGDPDWNPADLVFRFIVPAVSASPRR